MELARACGRITFHDCHRLSAKEFSAVGYFFALDLAKDIKVPIGLIESDWGGTRAEAWLPRPVFDSLKLPYELAGELITLSASLGQRVLG